MDLGRRLMLWLAALAGLWLVVTLVYTAAALRSGVQDEMQGAQAVVELLAAAAAAHSGDAASQQQLQTLLAQGRARHLSARWADAPDVDQGEQLSLLHTLARRLAPAGLPVPQHRIAIGERTLLIEPAPDSEVDEVLGDALPLLALLLAAGAAMLASAWWIVRQALAPASALCAGLARLAAGAAAPDFPPLRLREYAAIGQGIEQLAAGLASARLEQSRLAQRLIGVQERERRELAHDLHDEFGQHLTAMAATVSLLQRHAVRLEPARVADCAAQIADSLRCIGAQLRELLARLRPHGLDAASLPQELLGLVDKARARHPGLVIAAEIAPQLPALSEDAALALYRSLQEALTNALRHSGARSLQVRLDLPTPQALRLQMRDDGCGRADAIEARPRGARGGLGLPGMRERLAMVGGSLQLHDNPGGGLCVEVRVPARLDAAAAPPPSFPGESLDTRLAA